MKEKLNEWNVNVVWITAGIKENWYYCMAMSSKKVQIGYNLKCK